MAAVGIRRTVQRRVVRSKQPWFFIFELKMLAAASVDQPILRSIVGQLHPVSCPFLRQQKGISSSSLPLLSQKPG